MPENKGKLRANAINFQFDGASNSNLWGTETLKLAEIKVDSKIPTYDCGCYIKR